MNEWKKKNFIRNPNFDDQKSYTKVAEAYKLINHKPSK